MCGFAGILHWDRENVSPDELRGIAGLLRHRGPDELCAAIPSPGVGLVHARLKVIDLSQRARQPMANEERSVWLLYNGEIYNFEELRRELQDLGFLFRSRSDTEVVLRAYEAWGQEAVKRLDGMFAFAIWDERTRELLLVRDRTGKKPLFYWTDGRCMVFGSEIKTLLGHAHTPREVNESAIPFLLALGYPPTGRTCYGAIHQVPPASFIRLKEGETEPTARHYWDLTLDPAVPPLGEKEAVEQLRSLLTQAVRRRLIADVPLGAFLSGGVDSTIVVGLMRQLLPTGMVKTFSIGFEGDARFNETRYAQVAADRFQTQHTVFMVSPQSFQLLERLVWHHDQPFGDSSAIPTYLLSQLTRQHVTVALAGDGGDEAFAGYTRFAAVCWSQRMPSWIRKAASGILDGMPASSERSVLSRAKRFFRVAALPLPERYWQWISYLRSPNVSGLDSSLGCWWKGAEGGSLLSRLLYLNFKEYLPNDLLVKMDRCSMAHGLEVRSPFLDTAVMEWAARLPDAYKLAGWRTKVLLRRAFRGMLPAAIARRGKMGFGVPLASWFRGAWREPLQDALLSPTACLYRYLDRSLVRELVSGHLSGREDAGHRLWLLLTFEVWLRNLSQPTPGSPGAPMVWLEKGGGKKTPCVSLDRV